MSYGKTEQPVGGGLNSRLGHPRAENRINLLPQYRTTPCPPLVREEKWCQFIFQKEKWCQFIYRPEVGDSLT